MTRVSSLREATISEQSPTVTRFLGRQPILDVNQRLYGYELLYRAGEVNAFSGDPEFATRQVIDQYLLLMPDSSQGTAFVNCTREALVSGVTSLLPAENTVLEILETVDADPELIAACRALKAKGFRFALDDFTPDHLKLPLLEFADYIKIDFRVSSSKERHAIYELAKPRKSILIGEKIETLAEKEIAKEEGCHLFQGYFFSKPVVTSQRTMQQNHMIYMKLMIALGRDTLNFAEIEKLFESDASLCYRLLRLVNSALYGVNSPVTSIRSALVILGESDIRKLVTVAMAGVMSKNQSQQLLQMALERARFCELLAPKLNIEASKMYLLGMLSLLDAIVEVPIAAILSSIPIEAEMKAALNGKRSTMAMALDLVRSYEQGEWQNCESLQRELCLEHADISELYLSSVRWAEQAMTLS